MSLLIKIVLLYVMTVNYPLGKLFNSNVVFVTVNRTTVALRLPLSIINSNVRLSYVTNPRHVPHGLIPPTRPRVQTSLCGSYTYNVSPMILVGRKANLKRLT